MEVKELMIGDWICSSINDINVRIAPADLNWDNAHTEWLANSKPIPLTAEILENNGWKDISDHTLKGCETFKLHYEQRAFDFYITIKLRDYFKLESYDDRFYTLCEMEFGCRYVHQLQHALRLCGIDKEIVL